MRVGVAMDLDQVQRSLHVASIGELEAFWTENVLGATAEPDRDGVAAPHGHCTAQH